MKKEDVRALIGKGFVEIAGVRCRIDFSKPDDDFVVVTVPAINEFSLEAKLGQVWFQYTDDAWWADLENALKNTVAKMVAQSEIALKEPIELVKFFSEKAGKEMYKNESTGRIYERMDLKDHFEIYTTTPWSGGYEASAPINRPIIIEGVKYVPIWSWWLDRGCYLYKENSSSKEASPK